MGALKTRDEIALMRRAGKITAGALRAVCEAAQPGVTLTQLDKLAHTYITDHGATPNFLGYRGYPATFCMSVNDVVVHGIPSDTLLQAGDIVSFDGGCLIREDGREWHSDSARTVIVGGEAEAPRRWGELNRLTQEAMWVGIAKMAFAKKVGQIGAAIEDLVALRGEDLDWEPQLLEGYSGHGIGNSLHEDPEVYNYRVNGRSVKLKPGMVLCIEPMLVIGDASVRELDDGWTVKTVSGNAAAHWEHTVALLPEGIAVLTAETGGVVELAEYGVTPVLLD